MIECLGESLVILSLHIFLFYYVWALGRCSASRILGEKNAWKFLWRHLFTYFSFQQRKKALFWRPVLWNIRSSSETQSTSYAWESRGKGEGGTPKALWLLTSLSVQETCQSPGWPDNMCRSPASCIKKERLAPQCGSRLSPLCPKHWWGKGN